MIHKKTLIQALSIIVANYPEHPSKCQQQSMCNFFRILSAILGHRLVPVGFPPHLFRIRRNVTKSRLALTGWLTQRVNLRMWYGASDSLTSPRIWGPFLWGFLHEISTLYVYSKRKAFFCLLLLLPDLLPCHECADNFSQLIIKKQLHVRVGRFRTTEQFVNLMNDIHRDVSDHVSRRKIKTQETNAKITRERKNPKTIYSPDISQKK